ncbi:1-acyl-sn-glycerol-3-phosphate acyltransferase [Rubricoccus marinus]|uniref:Phospholipid/glycerol acyltransferase domain-containing protein n=1 Tax=Rubricoccus marinus TaxID=716817 RepID=A0A259U320_9BACT|nr:1-acyl-sn-glycerol-3-phosphate acyltransferase [Rubricoccus marinus]OZC04366.1 hypothetical protein BSZ36_16095 [Rubricoccus marinus]
MPTPLTRTYTLVRGAVRWMLRLFFREIAVEGREHIPADRGGLLVAWHPNGVIDAGLMLAAFPGHVVFGARDGLLRWPILGNMMRAAGTVPIYRAQDQKGMSEADRRAANQRSLDALAGAVAGGSFSALFPEGQSHDAPHVTPVKSGAARIFLRAHDLASGAAPALPAPEAGSFTAPPVIIPVGLHYDDKAVFRSDVLVVFHPPLALSPEALADPHVLSAEIERALVRVVHATEDWDLHRAMIRASSLMRAEMAARDGRLAEPATIAERHLDFEVMWTSYHARLDTHPAEIEALRRDVAAYRRKMRLLGMNDADLDRPGRSGVFQIAWALLQAAIAYLVLRPLFLLGFLVSGPPYWALKPLARKVATAEKDKATIKLLGGLVLFPLAWITASVVAAFAYGPLRRIAPWLPDWPIGVIGALAFVLCVAGAVVALRSAELTLETWRTVRARMARRMESERVDALRRQRADLHDRLVALAQGLPAVERIEGAKAPPEAV